MLPRSHETNSASQTSPRAWYREPEFWIAILLAVGIYGVRLGEPNLRGEEPRRGLVAIEMLQTGDLVTPRQQGTLFLSRPPLQNWLIALIGNVRGQVDAIAIRLPSAVATVLVVCLLYGYTRSFLSRLGAFAAAISYGTCGQVLELGKMGETEALFVLLVASSLMLWHYGFTRGWPAWKTWSTAYVLVAMGMLTKGLQAPMYFAGSVGFYLLLTRRWRFAFSGSHLLGIVVFGGLWGAWQVPYYLAHGWENSIRIYSNDVGLRFSDTSWGTIFTHLVVFPLEVLVCLMPWSILLAVYFFPSFWKSLGKARQPLLFALCCLAITFPTCWLVPGAKGRYYMPLYPCFSVLTGLALQRCWEADGSRFWHGTWKRFATGLAVVMTALSGTLAAATWLAPNSDFAQPISFLMVFLVLSLTLSFMAWLSRGASSELRRFVGLASVALFLGLAYTGTYINYLQRRSTDTFAQMEALQRQLPDDARLVSFGLINHLFSYYYVDPIEPQEPPLAGESPEDTEFFCFSYSHDISPPLDEMFEFEWEPLAVISCDRYQRTPAKNVVYVGRVTKLADSVNVAAPSAMTELR